MVTNVGVADKHETRCGTYKSLDTWRSVCTDSVYDESANCKRSGWSAAEASHAGITVESCTVLLPALEVAMFGRTLSDAELWKRRQEQATANVVCNPFFLSL